MEKSRKSRKSKKNHPKYAYMLPAKSVMCTGLGDRIILEGHGTYVCGACLLLLMNWDAHYSSRLLLRETHRMPPMRTIPFASSKCGCVLSIKESNLSLFPNSLQKGESTFMAFSLTCHCILEIRLKVDGLFHMAPSGKQENLLSYGERVMWMRKRLMVLES